MSISGTRSVEAAGVISFLVQRARAAASSFRVKQKRYTTIPRQVPPARGIFIFIFIFILEFQRLQKEQNKPWYELVDGIFHGVGVIGNWYRQCYS